MFSNWSPHFHQPCTYYLVLKGTKQHRNIDIWIGVYGDAYCSGIIRESLHYKLRMFGVPLEGPANVFGDNASVVTNATIPSSTLKKKHNSIAYHRVREAIATKMIRVGWVKTNKNLADILTKPLPRPRLHALCEKILYLYKDKKDDITDQAN